MTTPTFDADGYPSDETLEHIEALGRTAHTDEWLRLVREAWNHHYGVIREKGGRIEFATGGWSGNESIIGSMKGSFQWIMLWESSHRGGLHVLRKPCTQTRDCNAAQNVEK